MSDRTTVIGIDEAGYGPNIGPLVIAATAWEVDSSHEENHFWSAFEDVLTQDGADRERLHVADSKQVYSPQRGRTRLEQGAFAALHLFQHRCPHLTDLITRLDCEFNPPATGDPSFNEGPLPLPDVDTTRFITRWQDCCERSGIVPVRIAVRVVWPSVFNRLLIENGNKSTLLSRCSLQLVRSIWNDCKETSLRVICDKHGGRNRYHDLLSEIADGEFVTERCAGSLRSCYEVGQATFEFRQKAESHLAVALASMIAKTIRELSMDQVNAYWTRHLPDLRPTKGYPQDARRFRADITPTGERLGIPWEVLWRDR